MTFEIRSNIFDPKTGEYDEVAAEAYQDELEALFAESAENQALAEQGIEQGWISPFLTYGMSYLSVTPPHMTLQQFDELLFNLFPRKVAVGADQAAEIVQELRAFWTFLERAYELPNATAIIRRLDDRAVSRLERALANPANFGMAKSFVMQGQLRGFDTTTREGLDTWMHTYNAELTLGEADDPIGFPAAPPLGLGLDAGYVSSSSQPQRSNAKNKSRRKMAKASRKQNRRK